MSTHQQPDVQNTIDTAAIFAQAGGGGNGASSFRREKFVPRGGPDGGDGGRGGSVYLRASPSVSTLIEFSNRRHFKAGRGGNGAGAKKHGKAGENVRILVPVGTVVALDGELLADLSQPDDEVMVARGGRGGLGNVHFKTATNQAPTVAQKGEPGEERWLTLELKTIADVGLVGYPNVGKSSLLAALTAARPKIGDYPFTTLEPNLGVMDLSDAALESDDRRVTIADVPGLIEGASSGAGLGHAFLRHVERTRVLVHVVDGSAADPEWSYGVIREELDAHDPALLRKPMLVAFNKIDLSAAADAWPGFRDARSQEQLAVVAVSAASGEGLTELPAAVAALLPRGDDLESLPEPTGEVFHRLDAAP